MDHQALKALQPLDEDEDLWLVPGRTCHDTEPSSALPYLAQTLWQPEVASGVHRKTLGDEADIAGLRALVRYLQEEIADEKAALRRAEEDRQSSIAREMELHVRAVAAERRAQQAESRARAAELRAELALRELRELDPGRNQDAPSLTPPSDS